MKINLWLQKLHDIFLRIIPYCRSLVDTGLLKMSVNNLLYPIGAK